MDAAAECQATAIGHTAAEPDSFGLAGCELLRRRCAGTDENEQNRETSRNSFEF
jgi:hypothetical protein